MATGITRKVYIGSVLIVASCLVIALLLKITEAGTFPRFPYRIVHVDSCPSNRVQEGPNHAAASMDLSHNQIFREQELLLDMSHDADKELKAWLLPAKTGMIWTAFNETLRLSQGISMFHAMHCLLMIRRALQAANDTSRILVSEHSKEHSFFDDFLHVPHCFSYVAQHVMCLGDSTIEPPWVHQDDAGNILEFGVDGENVPHKCKDTAQMRDIAHLAREATFKDWGWREGDTVESVFSDSGPDVIMES